MGAAEGDEAAVTAVDEGDGDASDPGPSRSFLCTCPPSFLPGLGFHDPYLSHAPLQRSLHLLLCHPFLPSSLVVRKAQASGGCVACLLASEDPLFWVLWASCPSFWAHPEAEWSVNPSRSSQTSGRSQYHSLRGSKSHFLLFYSWTPSQAISLEAFGCLTGCQLAGQLYLHHLQTHILEHNSSSAMCWGPCAPLIDEKS